MRQDRRTPHWRALLWGLPLFGALLAGAGTLSVPRIEDDLRAKVRASLAQAGFTELNVDMSGRDALIASADNYPVGAKETVRELAVQWGVRKADVALIESASASGPSATSVPAGAGNNAGAAAVRPPVGVPLIFAEVENGKLTLRGSYAQESQHDRLLAAATSAYGAANVTDQLSAAAQGEEAPTDDGIAALATALAATAADFVAGQVGFGAGRITMEGTAADAAGRDRLLDVLKATERKGVPVKSTLSLAKVAEVMSGRETGSPMAILRRCTASSPNTWAM